MTRCAICTANVILPSGKVSMKTLRTWSSYAELDSLARAGCDLCMLIRQHCYYFWGPGSDQEPQTDECKIYLMGMFDPPTTRRCLLYLMLEGRLDRILISRIVYEEENLRRVRFPPPSDLNDVQGLARSLLQDCCSSHKDCEKPPLSGKENPTLPRRLLDLSHGSTIKLIDVANQLFEGSATTAELSRYCTLSYRWGSAAHDCILGAPFSRMIELVLDSLPQTFKDAILIARALDVRFLWIDALCIVQPSVYGDDTDWKAEGSRMGAIYRGALCTIAATCAESDDGFLSKVGSKLLLATPCKISTYTNGGSAEPAFLEAYRPNLSDHVGNSNLNKRGWVQQERTLSRRVLHFTDHGIFRECYQMSAHSYYGDIASDSTQDLIRFPRTSFKPRTDVSPWHAFIENYSASEFTYPEDRLIALSSVARVLQPKFADSEYYAGLWSEDLLDGLLWYCDLESIESMAMRLSVAPSWSWASVIRPVRFSSTEGNAHGPLLVDVLRVAISPESIDNAYGNVKRAELKMSGQLLMENLPTTNHVQANTLLYWDEVQDTTKATKSYTTLPIRARSDFSKRLWYHCIVLDPLPVQTYCEFDDQIYDTYRRIGYLDYVYAQDMDDWRKKFRKHKRKILKKRKTIIIV